MYKPFFIPVVLSLTFIMSACGSKTENTQYQQPLQQIDVAQVLVTPVQSWHTYTTRLESPEEVALMPRVSGVIQNIAFKEGEEVSEGDLLIQLDDRPFVAEVNRLKAQVNSAKAALIQAQGQAERAKILLTRNAISTEETEARKATLRQTQAQVIAIQAQLDIALLNIEFTSIRSPINGIISRANITKGNNVMAGQTVLTSIVSDHKMFAYFDIDERTWNQSFSDVTIDNQQAVIMQLLGQTDFPHAGYVDFIDNRINTSTGTLRVRAVFENAAQHLRNGSFARIRIAANKITDQIIVPTTAIGTDLKNRFILTIDENNILQYKPITLGDRYGNLTAVTAGLNEGDVVAVNGPARVGPGMPVKPNNTMIESEGIAFTLGASNITNLALSSFTK